MSRLSPSSPSWTHLAFALAVAVAAASSACKRDQKAPPPPVDKATAAKAAAQELAGPAYQQWSTANPNRPCPSIEELVRYAPKLALDPWGHPYRARCSAEALAGTVREVMISSMGPDGLTNTDDDVKSK